MFSIRLTYVATFLVVLLILWLMNEYIYYNIIWFNIW